MQNPTSSVPKRSTRTVQKYPRTDANQRMTSSPATTKNARPVVICCHHSTCATIAPATARAASNPNQSAHSTTPALLRGSVDPLSRSSTCTTTMANSESAARSTASAHATVVSGSSR